MLSFVLQKQGIKSPPMDKKMNNDNTGSVIIITFQLHINGYSLIISRRFFMINNNQIDKIK
ncbi:hypothetical protein ACUOCP_13735, partial [Escherichia sp. R-CC3]